MSNSGFVKKILMAFINKINRFIENTSKMTFRQKIILVLKGTLKLKFMMKIIIIIIIAQSYLYYSNKYLL